MNQVVRAIGKKKEKKKRKGKWRRGDYLLQCEHTKKCQNDDRDRRAWAFFVSQTAIRRTMRDVSLYFNLK